MFTETYAWPMTIQPDWEQFLVGVGSASRELTHGGCSASSSGWSETDNFVLVEIYI